MAPLSPPLLVSVESLPDENVVDYTLKFTNLKYVSSLSTPKAARRELNCIELFRCAQTTESTSVSH